MAGSSFEGPGQLGWLAWESLRGFRRSGSSALAAAWSTGLSSVLLFLSLLAWQGFDRWSAEEATKEGWIEAFLVDSTSAEGLRVAALRLSALPEADRVELVDKALARERFVAQFGEEMLREVQGNPLPMSVRIQVRGVPERARVEALAARVARDPAVEEVQSPSENLEELRRMSTWARRGAVATGVLLLAVVFGVVRNAIELSLRSRGQLIDNMRILGASRFQIEAPFAVEGLFVGLLGGFLASALPTATLLLVAPWLPLSLGAGQLWAAGAMTLAFAGLAGLAGGWWTVHRALR